MAACGPASGATADETEKADPLCDKYQPATQRLYAEIDIDMLARRDDADERLSLIQSLKMIQRCGSETEKAEVLDYMKTTLGEERALPIWKESTTTFGGYRGVYPGYYQRQEMADHDSESPRPRRSTKFNFPNLTIDDLSKYVEGGKASGAGMA